MSNFKDIENINDFAEKVTKDTPRIVVNYRLNNGNDEFSWGVTNGVPVAAGIGALGRVQVELATYYHSSYYATIKNCPDHCLVLVWDVATKECEFYLHPDLPVDGLIGTLEIIKVTMVTMQMSKVDREAGGSRDEFNVLGLDGKLFRG